MSEPDVQPEAQPEAQPQAPEAPPREQAPDPLSAVDVLACALCAGVLAGLGEVLVVALQHYHLGRHVLVGEQIVWMSPVANLALALLLALGLLATGARRLSQVGAVLGGLVLLAMSMHNERLHWAAMLILDVGVAYQIALWLEGRQVRTLATIRRAALPLVALVVALGVGLGVHLARVEGAAIAALPEVSQPPQRSEAPGTQAAPNVVVIVLDTVRAENMSVYGYAHPKGKTTPYLERMAAAGARFDMALATSCWTLPSHASMFTGRYPDEMSANWTSPLDDDHPVLAEVLARRGYRTGGFIANFFYCNREFGLGRGFHRYDDYGVNVGEVVYSSSVLRRLANTRAARRVVGHQYSLGYRRAHEINDAFLGWLDGSQPEGGTRRPFFAFLNYMEGHHPYYPPEPWASQFASSDERPDPRRWFFDGHFTARFCHTRTKEEMPYTDVERRLTLEAYDGAIRYLDHCIEQLCAQLEARGELENTLIVVTSDHGEHFGEHEGLWGHGVSLHTQETRVPLLMKLPGRIPAGAVASRPVTLRDLAATILDLAGAPAPGEPTLPGHSLRAAWTGGRTSSPVLSQYDDKARLEREQPARRHALVVGGLRGHRDVEGSDKPDRIYDLQADPGEQRPLDAPMRLEGFRRRLEAVRDGDR